MESDFQLLGKLKTFLTPTHHESPIKPAIINQYRFDPFNPWNFADGVSFGLANLTA